jgi:hypothetical protein
MAAESVSYSLGADGEHIAIGFLEFVWKKMLSNNESSISGLEPFSGAYM